MSYPIWFLRHGNSESSAVLVRIRKAGSPDSSVRLLTVQHAVRQTTPNSNEYGNYAGTINAWAPEFGFNPQRPIQVRVDTALSPPDQNPQLNVPDLAFLSIVGNLESEEPVPLLPDLKCKAGLTGLTVAGFSGGDNYLRQHRDLVIAPAYSGWKFGARGAGLQDGTLVGPGGPEAGASGGGVFRGDQYAGLYRGEFVGLGGHLFIPIYSIRNYLAARGYELVDPPAKLRFVNKLQQNIPSLIGVVLGLITLMWAWTHPHPNMISLGLPLSVLAFVLSLWGVTKWLPRKRLSLVRTTFTAIVPLAFLTFVAMSGIAWKWRIVQIDCAAKWEANFKVDAVEGVSSPDSAPESVYFWINEKENVCFVFHLRERLNSNFGFRLKERNSDPPVTEYISLNHDPDVVKIGLFPGQLFPSSR